MKLQKFMAFSVVALALAACGGKVEPADVNPTPSGMKQGPGLFSGEGGNLRDAFGGNKSAAAALPVNPFLWRAALETLSFLPLEEVDSTGGVLTTGWAVNPEKKTERSRVNVLILGRALSPQTLKVNVFKQRYEDGMWQDMPSSTETATQLEETILTKARTLRVREQAAQ